METLTTKEKIIKAAFSFYKDYDFNRISLSQIASRVGISKAAIFRHFKNKDDLLCCMKDIVFTGVAEKLLAAQEENTGVKSKSILALIMSFFCSHIEYINFANASNVSYTLDDFVLELKKRGLVFLDSILEDDGSVKDLKNYRRTIYTTIMIMEFVHFYDSAEYDVNKKMEIEDYTEKVAEVIEKGFCSELERISDERIAELSKVCEEAVKGVPAVDKTFEALSKIVEKSGYEGITMDELASMMGMAKSSFYSTFKNKEDMVFRLLEKEYKNLLDFFILTLKNARTFSEKIYVMYYSCICYFYFRSEILDACKYLRFSSSVDSSNMKKLVDSDSIEKIWNYIFVQDCSVDMEFFLKRIVFESFFIEPVYLLLHFFKHNISEEKIKASPKELYSMLCYGIRN